MMDGKLLPSSMRSPVLIGISDGATEFCSGCAVIDVSFPKSSSVDIDEIRFKNYYVAYVSVLVRFYSKATDESNNSAGEWQTAVRSMQLMPQPHCERASEDYFVIRAPDMLCSLCGVSGLRFVLQQPSPQWKEFKLEEVQIYGLGAAASVEPASLRSWISDLLKDGGTFRDEERQLKGITSVSEISKRMQNLWALTAEAKAHQTSTTLGRYDVDGCYDVNVLSYT